MVSLEQRAVSLTEYIDDPDCDPIALRHSYAAFAIVNPVVSGWRKTYRRLIRPWLSPTEPRTLLDVGAGGGDIARGLARWARADGVQLTVTAIDPDPRAYQYAIQHEPSAGVYFRRAHTSDLVAEGAVFDFVISNHVLHHLDEDAFTGLLADSERLSRVAAVHADLVRTRWAYAGFGAATMFLFRDSFIRHDGLASIRRSYTLAELRETVPPRWRVIRQEPSRLLLTWSPGAR
ncbi:class I SAM-dependent methyltransferase [Diaminobutyricimonas sp. LJ205]|uniref:class I SAM-dependent methyltransferase n=1 Tax=Diaminobutyricimonas sp. LJ205 TaxID=2683590 RepID=UPI0012F4D873|nr:class I SAM-dependent methyltransferase [Diaminobutyricimonas sp. LJ205]